MKKELGQVFTPKHIVSFILDESGYKNKKTLTSKIMEPSFGEGAFLLEIIDRIIKTAKKENLPAKEIENIIKDNVYGVEIDRKLYSIAMTTIRNLLTQNNLNAHILDINLINGDTLYTYQQFPDYFDFIVGNPPYVRVKNLSKQTRENIKNFNFAKGTTDLYIVFFELAFHMLKPTGKIGFITPNSYLYNSSQQHFREFLFNNKCIEKIYNYEDIQLFDSVSTRTCVSVFTKTPNQFFKYTSQTKDNQNFQTNIDFSNINCKHPYYLKKEDSLIVNKNGSLPYRLGDFIDIYNGVATNKDSVYIKSLYDIPDIEDAFIYPCIKASRCDTENGNKIIIFPYKEKGNGYIPLSENEFMQHKKLSEYLITHKETLSNRDMDKNTVWFLFARQQGLKHLNQEKIVIKHIFLSDNTSVYAKLLPASHIVYSGLFIVPKIKYKDSNILSEVLKILTSEEFCLYAKILGRKKQGGYTEITANIIKNFRINNSFFAPEKFFTNQHS